MQSTVVIRGVITTLTYMCFIVRQLIKKAILKESRCTTDSSATEEGEEELVDPLPAKLRKSVVCVIFS